jgi:hypothetical protein
MNALRIPPLLTSLILSGVLLSGGTSLAQDAPPKPELRGQGADALAELLLRARDEKVLQHRLFTKRVYRANEKRGQVVLVTGQGKATEGGGFQFQLAFEALSGDEKGRLNYEFNAEGRLISVGMFEERRGSERGVQATIANGVATQTKIRDGKPSPKTREAPWTGDMISLFSALVLAPSLGDLGLDASATFKVVNEDDKIGRSNPRPADLVIRREKPSAGADGVEVQTVFVEEARRSRPMAKIVLGTGKDQGVIKEFVIDPKPDGRYDLRLVLIEDEEVERLTKQAPLLRNEYKAQRAISQIWSAQTSFKRGIRGRQGGQGTFASSMEDLAKAKLIYDKELAEGTSPGYIVLIRASADGQHWMAVAAPDEPGKTGRYYYVTNDKGVTYRSEKQVELDDSCKIPEGLEKLR